MTASSGGEHFGRMAARRGKARRGQRGRVSGRRGAGAARGAQRGGARAVKARHMAGEGGRGIRQSENRAEQRGWR
jgi:hypothetical protein